MSEIVIRNMKMPKSCSDCPSCVRRIEGNEKIECYLLAELEDIDEIEENYDRWYYNQVHRLCPLVELPPHGRLIDADALGIKDEWALVETSKIWDAPTVLEASEE